MSFRVTELSFTLVEQLRPLVEIVKRRDKSLADQLQRAANSVALNLAEGEMSGPGTQRARSCSAAGSANEVRAAVRLAVAWRHVTPLQAAEARASLDKLISMLWAMTRR